MEQTVQPDPPELSLFTTDTTHMKIISYMKAIHQFITSQLFGNALCKCIMKRLVFDESTLLPNPFNQAIFNRKWNENQHNFEEASCTAKCRRELRYEDKLVLTLFYVLYNIELYDEHELEEDIEKDEADKKDKEKDEANKADKEDEKKIYVVSDTISSEHNEMGQLYVSLYKQLQHCCIVSEDDTTTMIISPEKSKEYFIM